MNRLSATTALMTRILDRLTAAPIIPAWLIVALLACGLAAALFQYYLIRKRLGRTKALAISLLRLGAYWLLILFALNISLISKEEHNIKPSIAILLDVSRSMALPGKDAGSTRLDEARKILLGEPIGGRTGGSKPLLAALAQDYDVRLYALGDAFKEVDAGELPGLRPGGKGGDLDDALGKLAGRAALALLLSDGASTPAQRHDGSSSTKGLPVLTIPIGDANAYKDILVSAVKAPPVAFRGREITVDAALTGHGYRNVTIPVLLKDGSRLVTAKSIHFNKESESVGLSFSFTLNEPGAHALSVSTPPQVGESITTNNSADLSVRVIRDKTRIVMVSGSPSPNYRFMRMALKNDPSVDLLSFVILRTPSNVINVPLQEQSLIPFPVDTLFSGELKDFDLVIFDNLPLHVYLNQKHLEAIQEFVRSGGGFALIGGPNLSDGKRIVSTALGELLPVGLTQGEDYSRASPAGVRLTSAGAVHPVTRLAADKGTTQKLWNEMPPLDGVNLLKVKDSGRVLLQSADPSGYPVLTVGSYGKGRVLTLATDFSWKWDAGMVAKGGDNWAYLRFMERAVRWLTKDPGLDPVVMSFPDRAEEGQDVEIKVQIGESAYGPPDSSGLRRGNEAILFSAFSPQGVKLLSRVRSSGAPGEYIGSFHPEKRGEYKVRVETRTGTLEGTVVVAGELEGVDAAPHHDLLRSLSTSTGGKVVAAGDAILKEIEPYTEKARKRFTEEREKPLWSLPYALALVVALLAMEWFLRRRWGLA